MLAFIAIGRQVFNFDMSELSSRRNDFILAFSENDPAVLDPICAALGG